LKDVASSEPAELYWIIKNGVKMTGMPSFSTIGMEDNEIWSVVAFIRKLPVSDADFKTWTAGPEGASYGGVGRRSHRTRLDRPPIVHAPDRRVDKIRRRLHATERIGIDQPSRFPPSAGR